MAVGDIFRIQVNMQAGSQPTMNVLHARQTIASGVNEDINRNVLEMAKELYTALAAQLSEDWRVVSMRSTIVSPFGLEPPMTLVLGAGSSIEGGIASEMVPSNAPLVISLYSFVGGKKGMGRIFLPGIPEASQTDGQLSEAAYTPLQTAATAELIGSHGPYLTGAAEWEWIVWSPTTGPGANLHVRRATVRPNLANMRSRRAFEGFAV